ncbi:MAG: class I SAM-dependent methyltransferase [Thiotrichaceae bacterium]|nr:class I SAM-dependent methyltransferase [Thiotrichaceae bacterium]
MHPSAHRTTNNTHPLRQASCWLSLAALLSVPLIVNASPDHHGASDSNLQQVINDDHRSAKNKARDEFRKPLETLSWLGIKDNMTVIEVTPGGGWYTEILAPYLKDNGTYYAAGFDGQDGANWAKRAAKRFNDKLTADPASYGKVNVTVLAPPSKTEIAPAGSADMVLTFRNVHNWMKAGTSDAVFAAMHNALKSGGTLGVVEHRGNPDVKQDPKAKSGYVNQSDTIAMAEKAGFKLVGKSELLANPKDSKDHKKGVWTLLPSLRLGKEDQDKYLAIGESDRMLLKFVK